jgi:Tat protein translocase TatB subunit
MFGIGPMELLLILIVALLVLGPKRMPELARTLGRGLGEFRRASNELRQSLAIDELQNELRDGLTGAGSIRRPMKRPDADDPPAQAGADLPPGEGAEADARHPGELPLDADPHAHHGEATTSVGEGEGDAADQAPRASQADAADETSRASQADATDETSRASQADPSADAGDHTAPVRPRSADSTLGSVPVGGRTPEGGVPAGGDRAGSSERERG